MPPDTNTRVIAGRYSLGSPLGRGGMGTVWKGEDELLQRAVAVKEVELPPVLSGGERDEMQQRVLREARAAARLNHRSVVTIFDVVQEGGRGYVVMELLDAPSLEDLVARHGPLPVERVAEIGLQVLDALAAAHAQGIVHRDVKPSNVIVPDSGPAKLADFGIASVKGDPKITATGAILGSPAYMAPEQADATTSGAPADLWSLGATLYFAVEAQAPFGTGQPITTLTAVVHEPPRATTRAGRLEPVLQALLVKDPQERPSIDETRSLLEGVAGGATVTRPEATTPHPAPGTAAQKITPRQSQAPVAPTRTPTRRDRSAWLVALAVILLLGALAAVLIPTLSSDEDEPERRAAGQGAPKGDGDDGGAPSDTDTSAVVPADWTTYQDPATGYELSYPPGWQVVPGSGNITDFRDAESGGTYLRVDWTDTPGESPEAAWEQQSERFATNHDAYEELQITPTTFMGFDAAIWEYRYTEGGLRLHAVDLGFVTGDYGFALNFQTQDDAWEESQDVFDAFKVSFAPPQ